MDLGDISSVASLISLGLLGWLTRSVAVMRAAARGAVFEHEARCANFKPVDELTNPHPPRPTDTGSDHPPASPISANPVADSFGPH